MESVRQPVLAGLYLIDRNGRIVYTHFGEGDYAQTGATIQQALAQK